MIEAPLFVVGAQRSGTTVLGLMLDAHPKICWRGEFEYAVNCIAPSGAFPALADYVEWLQANRIFQFSAPRIDPGLNYAELVNSFLQQKLDETGKPLVGATVHHDFQHLPRLWPEARYVHLVRDGRDVTRSQIEMGWGGGNGWSASADWLAVETQWDQLAATLPGSRRMELRYEELIREPKQALSRVCGFMGLEFNAAMLDYPQHTSYARPDPALLGQWREKLPELEIRRMEARIGPMLEQRGYPLSGLPPIQVPARQAWLLEQQNRFARWRYNVELLGPGLWLAEFLARRLGLRGWRRRLTPRIHAAQNARLK